MARRTTKPRQDTDQQRRVHSPLLRRPHVPTKRDVRPDLGRLIDLCRRVDKHRWQDRRPTRSSFPRGSEELGIRLLELSQVERRSWDGRSGRLDLTPEVFGFVDEHLFRGGQGDDDVLFETEEVVLFAKGVFAVGRAGREVREKGRARGRGGGRVGFTSVLVRAIHSKGSDRYVRGVLLLGLHGDLDLVKERPVEHYIVHPHHVLHQHLSRSTPIESFPSSRRLTINAPIDQTANPLFRLLHIMQDLRRGGVVYDTPVLGSRLLGHVHTEDGTDATVLGMQVGEFGEGEGRADVGVDHVEFFEVGEDCVPDCKVGAGNETEGFLLARLIEDAECDHCLCPCLRFDRRCKKQKSGRA